jgi:GNAT superfamily N-acetyltransferase
MISFVNPVPSDVARWEDLTFPLFRSRLAETGVVAVGAELLGTPAGLALAEVGPTARLLSIAVRPSFRGRGIAQALLERIEAELADAGCARIETVFIAGQASTPALEHVLAARGFSVPTPRMLVCRSTIVRLRQAAFVETPLPKGAGDVFAWAELSAGEREAIVEEQRASAFYPEWASPFGDEARVEPTNSLGLRRGGRVIGWMVTHRILPDTVRYSRLFVRPGTASGAGIALVGRAIRLHAERLAPGAPLASMDLAASNRMMLNFLARRLRPALTDVSVSKVSLKDLPTDRRAGTGR